jgi:hypothetical protein
LVSVVAHAYLGIHASVRHEGAEGVGWTVYVDVDIGTGGVSVAQGFVTVVGTGMVGPGTAVNEVTVLGFTKRRHASLMISHLK